MKLQNILNNTNLPKTSDIVIIGGGVIGCSIAMHLSKTGFGSITLLEKNAISSGATSKSGAMRILSNRLFNRNGKRIKNIF